MRAWKGYYFCNWLRKNWPTLTSSLHWNKTKYWTPPLPFCSPYQNFRKNFPPLTCLVWNLGSPTFTKEGRKLWVVIQFFTNYITWWLSVCNLPMKFSSHLPTYQYCNVHHSQCVFLSAIHTRGIRVKHICIVG